MIYFHKNIPIITDDDETNRDDDDEDDEFSVVNREELERRLEEDGFSHEQVMSK